MENPSVYRTTSGSTTHRNRNWIDENGTPKEAICQFSTKHRLKRTPRGEFTPLNDFRLNAMSAFVVFSNLHSSFEWVAVGSLIALQVKRFRDSIGHRVYYTEYILSVILFTRIQSTVYIAVWSLLVIVQTRKYYLHTRKKWSVNFRSKYLYSGSKQKR